MKLPNALGILKEEVGPELWKTVSPEIKDSMLGTLRTAERLVEKDLRGEDTKTGWLNVKAQTLSWVSGSKAGLEAAWWRAVKVYAQAVGEALVAAVKAAAKGALG